MCQLEHAYIAVMQPLTIKLIIAELRAMGAVLGMLRHAVKSAGTSGQAVDFDGHGAAFGDVGGGCYPGPVFSHASHSITNRGRMMAHVGTVVAGA